MTSIILPAVSFIINFILIALYFNNERLINKDNKIFSKLLIVSLIHSLLDVFFILYISKIGANNITNIIQKIDFILIISCISLIYYYISSLADSLNLNERKKY